MNYLLFQSRQLGSKIVQPDLVHLFLLLAFVTMSLSEAIKNIQPNLQAILNRLNCVKSWLYPSAWRR